MATAFLAQQVLNTETCIRDIKIGLYKIQIEMAVCKSTKKNIGQGLQEWLVLIIRA